MAKALTAVAAVAALAAGGTQVWRLLSTPAPQVPAPLTLREDPASYDDPRTVLGSRYERESISSIRFEDSLAGAPEDAWDASEAGDGSVLAWVESNGDLYDLAIAGSGKVILPANGNWLFAYYENVKEIDFNGCVDTSNVTDMSAMFSYCDNLTDLRTSSGFVIHSGTDTTDMFDGCPLDMSGL